MVFCEKNKTVSYYLFIHHSLLFTFIRIYCWNLFLTFLFWWNLQKLNREHLFVQICVVEAINVRTPSTLTLDWNVVFPGNSNVIYARRHLLGKELCNHMWLLCIVCWFKICSYYNITDSLLMKSDWWYKDSIWFIDSFWRMMN